MPLVPGLPSRALSRTLQRLAAVAIVSSSLLLACGGGGGGGGGGPAPPTQPPPVPPTAPVSYTPDSGATSPSLSMSADTSGQQVTFTVTATDVNNLNGVAFDLVYPAALLTFDSASELTVFAGGEMTSFQVFQQSGRLVMGLARIGAASGFSGTGGLLTITFTVGTSGTGRLDFENQQGTQASSAIIGGLDWIGGSVTVN